MDDFNAWKVMSTKKDTIEALEYLITILKEETVQVKSCTIGMCDFRSDIDRPFRYYKSNAMYGNSTIKIDIDIFDKKELPKIGVKSKIEQSVCPFCSSDVLFEVELKHSKCFKCEEEWTN